MDRYDKLLILDLDETLVHSTYRGEPPRVPDFSVGDYDVCLRPHVIAFLAEVLDSFKHVAVWTAGTLSYAIPVLDQFVDKDRFSFVWGRERCTYRWNRETDQHVFLKPLKKVKRRGYRSSKVLFVDDSPEKISQSYGNYIYIPPFFGREDDVELIRLAAYLHELGPVGNVRPLDKRRWRERFPLKDIP